jgi:multisubunit Na+/H+ antiporter MnhG subunit
MQKLFLAVSAGITQHVLMNAAHTAGLQVIQKEKGDLYAGSIEFSLAGDKVVGVHLNSHL